MRATWPSGIVARAVRPGARPAAATARSRDDACAPRARAARDVARLAGRIDPVADVDAGERRPQRLRHLADRHAQRSGERRDRAARRAPASGPCVDRPTSTAPGTLRTSAATCLASRVSSSASGPCSCSWICFSPGLKPLLIDDVTPPSCTSSARMSGHDVCLVPRALGLRLQLARRPMPSSTASPCAADRRVGVARPRARCARCARLPAPSACV